MLNNSSPLILDLIFTAKQDVQYLGRVETPSATDKEALNPKGLYSTEIFGMVGTQQRLETFGYIDLGVQMIHPYIYMLLTTLSSLYERILTAKEYVVFNNKTKTFDISDRENGSTGYTYFIKHFPNLKLRESNSDDISNMKKVIEKYRKKGTITSQYLLVLPAGMREIEVGDDNRITEDEINDYYKTIINVGNILTNASGDLTTVDYLRVQLQKKLQELFLYIRNIIDGKKGFMLGQWGSSNVDYSTRSVLVGKAEQVTRLSDDMPDLINSSLIGVYQYANSIQPITVASMLKRFINNVIDSTTGTAFVYDQKTKRHINVKISDQEALRFSSSKGMISILNKLSDFDILNEVIMIGNYPLIIYTEVNKEVTVYFDSQFIPEDHKDKIKQMTYGELLYLSIYDTEGEYNSSVVRYPVAGSGSNTSSAQIMHTTNKSKEVGFSIMSKYGDLKEFPKVPKFPIRNEMWDNAFSAPYSRMDGLAGDFDGDLVGSTSYMSEEANKQLNEHRYKVVAYFYPNGKPLIEIEDAPAEMVALTLSK